jgi:hypothetical protein
MNLSTIHYRVSQFWNALWPSTRTTEDLAPAARILTEAEMALFSRLQPSEQTHALRVFQMVQESGENQPELLTAALLHDIGKICHPLRIWERVMIVLGKFLFPIKYESWGSGLPRGVGRAFVIAAQHPTWGAELTQAVKTSPLAVNLIQRHQEKIPNSNPSLENRLLARLQRADNLN